MLSLGKIGSIFGTLSLQNMDLIFIFAFNTPERKIYSDLDVNIPSKIITWDILLLF